MIDSLATSLTESVPRMPICSVPIGRAAVRISAEKGREVAANRTLLDVD